MGRVLVIDDSLTVVQSVRAALQMDGHVVDSVEFFVSLPAVLRERTPDLILLDLEMPGISGVKLGKFINDDRAKIPVLVYSSLCEAELHRAAREIRAVGALSKSVSPEILRKTVAQYLRRGSPPTPSGGFPILSGGSRKG